MKIKSFDQLSSLELDTLREIGNIGTGNAATALGQLLDREVGITLPEVRIMEYNEAIEWIGGPEVVTAGVLVGMGGQMSGVMLSVQKLEFINLALETMLGSHVGDYSELTDLDKSALVEVGNILISTFINALCGLSGISINLTVPGFTVDMQGAILTVPMAMYGGTSNYLMTIGGNFVCGNKQATCNLLLSPDVRSLNFLLAKLGVAE